MNLNKIETIDGLTEKQFNAEPGVITSLLVLVTGTNNAGQTGGFADIGRFVITRGGEPIINRPAKKFADIGDIREGTNVLNSTDGGDFEASFVIPFYEKGHPNALHIKGEKELNIRFIPADDGTVFSELDIEVQARSATIDERYNYLIHGNDESYASAITNDRTSLNQKNVTSIYIENVDDVLTDLQFESNNQVRVSNNSVLALQADTNYNNRIEDPTNEIIEIENHTPGVPGSTINRNNILRNTVSGAGNVDITVCAIDWINNGQGQGNSRSRQR